MRSSLAGSSLLLAFALSIPHAAAARDKAATLRGAIAAAKGACRGMSVVAVAEKTVVANVPADDCRYELSVSAETPLRVAAVFRDDLSNAGPAFVFRDDLAPAGPIVLRAGEVRTLDLQPPKRTK